jgi:hypothetical protein
VSSDISVALILTEIPTRARPNASLEPAYTIFCLTFAESGALKLEMRRIKEIEITKSQGQVYFRGGHLLW